MAITLDDRTAISRTRCSTSQLNFGGKVQQVAKSLSEVGQSAEAIKMCILEGGSRGIKKSLLEYGLNNEYYGERIDIKKAEEFLDLMVQKLDKAYEGRTRVTFEELHGWCNNFSSHYYQHPDIMNYPGLSKTTNDALAVHFLNKFMLDHNVNLGLITQYLAKGGR